MATPQVTAEPQRTLPTAANGTSVTPSGTAWANSAYAQMTASIGSAITIFGVIIDPAEAQEFEIDIARGAASSEVVVATFIGHTESLTGGTHTFLCEIPIDDIASGQRISCRMRKAGTTTTAWTVKLIYYNSVSGTVGVTANESLPIPSAAAGASITPNASAWVNSAWVQLSASLSDIALLGIVVNPAVAAQFELEIGRGAATSEVVVGTTGAGLETLAGCCDLIPFRIPIRVTGTNRISVRLRKSDTSTTTWTVKLLYISTSGFGAPDVGRTTQRQRISPDAAALVGNANSTTAWGNSGWLERIASTTTAIVVVGRTLDAPANASYEYDIGRGAASSEVVVTSDGGHRDGNVQTPLTAFHSVPVDNIASGQRVALRHRDSNTSADTWDHGLTYYETPL